MTPQEKAKELVKSFTFNIGNSDQKAKEFAIVSVMHTIQSYDELEEEYILSFRESCDDRAIDMIREKIKFWQDVNSEIYKL